MPRLGRVLAAGSVALLVACSPAAEQGLADHADSAPRASVAAAGGDAGMRDLDDMDRGPVEGHPGRPGGSASLQQGASPAPSPDGVRRAVSPPPARKIGLTPGESPFMETSDMLGGTMIAEMRSERWEESVARFEADAMADPDAGELQRVYEQVLRESLSARGLTLARFGCGLSLCAGTILGPLEDGEARYEGWHPGSLPLPMPMFVQMSADNALYMEVRFTFSTDPAAQSVIIRG